MIRRAAQNLGLAFAPLVVSPLLPSPGRTGPDVGPDEYRELYAAALLVFAGLAAAATGVTLLLVAVDRCRGRGYTHLGWASSPAGAVTP